MAEILMDILRAVAFKHESFFNLCRRTSKHPQLEYGSATQIAL